MSETGLVYLLIAGMFVSVAVAGFAAWRRGPSETARKRDQIAAERARFHTVGEHSNTQGASQRRSKPGFGRR